LKLKPVDRYVGQFFLKIFIHEIFIFVFRVIFCAGPAAKINFGSGPFYIELSTAFKAAFFYVFQGVYPLCYYIVDKIRPNMIKVKN
jgi:hypothetical protein